MALIPVGRLQVATPETMADSVRGGTVATDAVDERVLEVAADLIEGDPALASAVAALVVSSAGIAQFQKCLHREGNAWVWDGPSGASATHFAIPDHTGTYVVREQPAPIPQATPAFNW